MAWVTELLVESELSYLISETTQPTTAETASFIASIEATCQGVLDSLKINASSIDASDTPICFLVVQQWALWGICSRVLAAAGGLIISQPQKEREYWDRFNKFWSELKDNAGILGSDTPYLTGDSSLISPDGLVDGDDDYDDPIFEMDMEW